MEIKHLEERIQKLEERFNEEYVKFAIYGEMLKNIQADVSYIKETRDKRVNSVVDETIKYVVLLVCGIVAIKLGF